MRDPRVIEQIVDQPRLEFRIAADDPSLLRAPPAASRDRVPSPSPPSAPGSAASAVRGSAPRGIRPSPCWPFAPPFWPAASSLSKCVRCRMRIRMHSLSNPLPPSRRRPLRRKGTSSPLCVRKREVNLFHLALQLQQREKMRLVEDAAARRKEHLHMLAAQRFRALVAEQRAKRGIDLEDVSVIAKRQHPARKRVVVRRHLAARLRAPAAPTSRRDTPSSREWSRRDGSCAGSGRSPPSPAACSAGVALQGIRPPISGAIASSEHCMTSEGTRTFSKSARLSAKECRFRETARDLRVGGTKARLEFLGEVRAIRIFHDHGRQKTRPSQIIALHHVQQPLDIRALESTDVVAVIDVARRRTDHDQLRKPLRLGIRRQHADHAAHRVSDEDHVAQIQLRADLEHIARVAIQRAGNAQDRRPTSPTFRSRRNRRAPAGSRPRMPA